MSHAPDFYGASGFRIGLSPADGITTCTWAMVHCASACFGKNPELIKLMGGRFKSHGTEVFKAMIADREHPTMRGFSGFDTWDETYVHDQHNEVDRTVLMYRVTKGKNEREPW